MNEEIKEKPKDPEMMKKLKGLRRRGRKEALDAAADERDRAERAIRKRQRQGSNYDDSERDLEDSYNPEGESLDELNKSTLQSYVKKALRQGGRRKGVEKAQRRLTAHNANQIGAMPDQPEVARIASKVQDSYDPTLEFADRVMREAFDKLLGETVAIPDLARWRVAYRVKSGKYSGPDGIHHPAVRAAIAAEAPDRIDHKLKQGGRRINTTLDTAARKLAAIRRNLESGENR